MIRIASLIIINTNSPQAALYSKLLYLYRTQKSKENQSSALFSINKQTNKTVITHSLTCTVFGATLNKPRQFVSTYMQTSSLGSYGAYGTIDSACVFSKYGTTIMICIPCAMAWSIAHARAHTHTHYADLTRRQNRPHDTTPHQQ